MTVTTASKKKAAAKPVTGVKAVKAVKSDKADPANEVDTVDNAGGDSFVGTVNNIGKVNRGGVLAGKELVDAIVSVLEERLAEKVSVIDLRKVSAAADWFVVCSGDNTSHTTAVASGVIGALKERHKTAPWRHEGVEDGRWALIDYTDVVVHVMLEEVRKYYNLEGLWGNVNTGDGRQNAASPNFP